MKFWELLSVLGRRGIKAADLPASPAWDGYRGWWAHADELVRDQDRSVLDHELPNDLYWKHSLVSETYFLDGTMLRRRRTIGDAVVRTF